MRFDGLAAVPNDWPRTAVTIGVFDGVHLGHRALIATAREAAAGHPLVAVTFDPHPLSVVRPESAPLLISSLDHRVELLQAAGVDAVVVMPFTHDLAALTAEDFVTEVVVDRLHASCVIVGESFRFGHRATGSIAMLREFGGRADFDVVAVDLSGTEDLDRWSSTYVRQCVSEGDVAAAAAALGRLHRVEGEVVLGDQRGRELGYPTANVDVDPTIAVPADGVYAGWLVNQPRARGGSGRDRWPAALSIGTNPTFDGTSRRVEAYVLDRTDLELYGNLVAIEFAHRLRETVRFDSVAALLEQMATDVDRSRRLLTR